MRSDAIDQLISSYLELPVRLSWEGSLADSVRGSFDGVSLEMAGVATAWMRLQRIRVEARRATFTPGLPPRIGVQGPVVSITIGQRDLDRWLEKFLMPFEMRLGEKSLIVNTRVAGLALSEVETRLEVVRGWFVLRPRRASILGVSSRAARFFRAYLPLPPLAPEARLVGIDHAEGRLTLRFGLGDVDEEVRPGLAGRLRRRMLPWA